ncbi:uncharacterized protein MONBRDRAFT_27360 [Monosiga brevicollis MX1]|uniref:Ribosomal protein S11 n=1 Tax=Monosiga brevicollis TaxID=81824 RepID=A9V524_MONBE|nr:uncharacterized protein MONBRDRAFT_27360 [Monosiga brevicollis MX1]EDQ87305.1 predicted protein [Monosiga brevicollis MX1]|eukprot:XP_001747918.1 hypothetical protein [Monosiga brevicollis MX1]
MRALQVVMRTALRFGSPVLAAGSVRGFAAARGPSVWSMRSWSGISAAANQAARLTRPQLSAALHTAQPVWAEEERPSDASQEPPAAAAPVEEAVPSPEAAASSDSKTEQPETGKTANPTNQYNIAGMSEADAADWMRQVSLRQRRKSAEREEDLESCLAHVKMTANNTIVTISRRDGNSLNWASAGSCGFKGARRSTTYAAQVASQRAAEAGDDSSQHASPCHALARRLVIEVCAKCVFSSKALDLRDR